MVHFSTYFKKYSNELLYVFCCENMYEQWYCFSILHATEILLYTCKFDTDFISMWYQNFWYLSYML